MSRKPFCIVTKRGRAVRWDEMHRWATKQESGESKQIDDPFVTEDFQAGIVKPPLDPNVLVQLLELNTYHMRACRTKARDAAGLGWRVTPTTEDTGDSEDEREQLEQFFRGLSNPLSNSLSNAQYDYESVGWGALELIRDVEGNPVDLVHVPSHTLRMHKSREKVLQRRGNKKVWFKLAGAGDFHIDFRSGGMLDSSAPLDRRATEIIWWRNYTQRSDYYGIPDIVPAIGAILGDVSRRDFNISFFENYGVPAYAVFITGDFDPGDPEIDPNTGEEGPTPLERKIEEHFSKLVDEPHSTLILSIPTTGEMGSTDEKVEVDIKPLSVDVKEASFRLYRQDNRDEVLAAHGVDPYRIGVTETGNLGGTTARTATEIYKESVTEPRQADLEHLINSIVVVSGFGITRWMFELNELDTSDPESDLNLMLKMFEVGAITPIEISRHFADRFGIDVDEMSHPALSAHYIDGVPVDLPEGLEPPMPARGPEGQRVLPADEVEAALRKLKDDLILAQGNGGRTRDEIAIDLGQS